jgi:sugar phosphate isomerase/epimerase
MVTGAQAQGSGAKGCPLLPADIGLPSQIHAALPLSRALELLAARTQLIEIYSAGRHSLHLAENRCAAEGSGLRLTVHGPCGRELDLGSADEVARRAAVAEHRRHAEAAGSVGALCYVVHPEGEPGAAAVDAAARAALRRSLAELEQVQRACGVRIAVENMPCRASSRFSAPGELDLGRLGLVLDCGHAAISATLAAFLADPGAELVHVHLHSNHGPRDAGDPHRPLGVGVVDAAAVLALARAAGATMVLEHSDESSVALSIAHLRAQGLAQNSSK